MEYRKIINLLDYASNQPSKFRTKNWVDINDESTGTYNTNSQIKGTYNTISQMKFKTAMLKSSLFDYSDSYTLVKGTITVPNTAAADADVTTTTKKVVYIDIVMPMYSLIEYSNNYSKSSGSLWQYCKDIPAVNNNGDIVEFNGAYAADSFNFKTIISGQTGDNGTKEVEIMMPLINCEVNLILTWSANCIIVYTDVANQGATFAITEIKLYVPVVTLSTQDNAKLLQRLKSGFKRIINWNKYL